MALLPSFNSDPTLEAMHRVVEAIENAKPKRDYLGASILGHECERFIYYQLNNADKAEPISYKGLYAIEDGHRTEQLVKDRLRLVQGIELYDIDEETKEQIGFVDGKFSGHVDGIVRGLIQAPKTWHIFEVKCCNEKKFKELQKCVEKYGEKNALENWDYTFFIQAQLYMGKLKLDRHYLICSTPGGRDKTSCRTEFQENFFNTMIIKKDRIINAKSVPERISSRKEYITCKWCRFSDFCWSGQ